VDAKIANEIRTRDATWVSFHLADATIGWLGLQHLAKSRRFSGIVKLVLRSPPAHSRPPEFFEAALCRAKAVSDQLALAIRSIALPRLALVLGLSLAS